MRKRTHQIKIWMNDEEYGLLLDKMQRSGQTRQNVMISVLKEATITTEEEISELKRSTSLMADLLNSFEVRQQISIRWHICRMKLDKLLVLMNWRS